MNVLAFTNAKAFKEKAVAETKEAKEKIVEILNNYGINLNTIYYPQNCAFITDFVSKIECEEFENNKFYKNVVENYLNILIAKIARSLTTQSDGFIVEYKTEYEFKNLRMMVFSNFTILLTAS